MKPSILILIVLFGLTTEISCQYRYYYGVEAGTVFTSSLIEKGEIISGAPNFMGKQCSFILGREFGKHLTLESGLNLLRNYESFRIRDYKASNDYNSWFEIPLKLSLFLGDPGRRIHYFSSLGIQYSYSYSGGGTSIREFPGTGESLKIEHSSIPGDYLLVRGAIGIRYRIVDELYLLLSAGASFGFRDVREYTITYLQDDVVLENAVVPSLGEYQNIMLGLTYPLGKGARLAGSAYNKVTGYE